MAHELDRKADGSAAMFSVRLTPWHREGTLLTEAPNLEEALRVAGLDFEVEVRPLYTRVDQYPGVPGIYGYRPAGSACATVRTDRETALGIVSDHPRTPDMTPSPASTRRKPRKVRYHDHEWERVVRNAEACGLPAATFIRRASLGATPRTRRNRTENDLILELGRMATHLHQLVRLAERGTELPLHPRSNVS